MTLSQSMVVMPRTFQLKGNHMKLVSILSLAALSFSALAINNSSLEPRHQAAIEAAVKKQCDMKKLSLTEIESEATPNRIDQGILDYEYVTVLEGKNQFDQGQFDYYRVTVESYYSDSYDHDARDWGSYSVSSVKCELL